MVPSHFGKVSPEEIAYAREDDELRSLFFEFDISRLEFWSVARLRNELSKLGDYPEVILTPYVFNKILHGRMKGHDKVVGVHFASMLNTSDFRILSQQTNSNGTIDVEFKWWNGQVWTKPKSSTLAPRNWTEDDIKNVTNETAHPQQAVLVTSTKFTSYLKIVSLKGSGDILWRVVANDNNNIIASYPLGAKYLPPLTPTDIPLY